MKEEDIKKMIREVMVEKVTPDTPAMGRRGTVEFFVVSMVEEKNDIVVRLRTAEKMRPFVRKIFIDAYLAKTPVPVELEVS